MAFFLIVPSVMILSILLIHGVASHFGMRLKYIPLILCAFGSIAVNFIALKTSPFLNRMLFVKLVVLILAASLLITFLNRYLINREALKNSSAQSKTKHGARVLETEELDFLPLTEPSTEEEAVKRRVEEIKLNKIKDMPSDERPASRSLVKLINEDKKSEKPKPKKKLEPEKTLELEKIPKPEPVVESAPVVESKINLEHKKIITLDENPEPGKIINFPKRVEPEKIIPVASTESKTPAAVSGLVTANEKLSAVIDKIKSNKAPATVKSILDGGITDEDIKTVESHLNSLDEILEFAYSQKNANNFKLAIFAYQKALERYRADDYAPFIAIDLSSIYKEQAAYTKAIKVCEDALTLPAVVRNGSARNDFSHDLAYLRTVQAVLARHRVLSTPFSKIPRQLMSEIDADFKKLTVLA